MKGKWIKRIEPQKNNRGSVVIFVHGVLSNEETCWTHKNNKYWPELLKNEEFNSLSICVLKYESRIDCYTYDIDDISDALREYSQIQNIFEYKRLIFVCHSMGGIVVRNFLVKQQTELIEEKNEIGLFLVASPSLGSSYAGLLAPLARLIGNTQAENLRFIGDNLWLHRLNNAFRALQLSNELKITGKELTEHKFIGFKKLPLKPIVERFAGQVFFPDPVVIPNSDHFSIAKPKDENAFQHEILCSFISKILGIPFSRNTQLPERNTQLPEETSPQEDGDGDGDGSIFKLIFQKFKLIFQKFKLIFQKFFKLVSVVLIIVVILVVFYKYDPFPLCWQLSESWESWWNCRR